MRLDLREVIHTPGAVKAFAFPLDVSQLEFYGQFPIVRPVEVEGRVVNHAGALCLEGAARSQLELVCDRCGQPFTRETREKRASCSPWRTASWIWTRRRLLPLCLEWTPKIFAQTTAKGCAPSVEPI